MTPNKLPPLPEPVAFVRFDWLVMWRGSGPIAPLVQAHGLKVGDGLYTAEQSSAYAAEALRQSQSLPAGAVAGLVGRWRELAEHEWEDSEKGRPETGAFDQTLKRCARELEQALQADAREKGEAVAQCQDCWGHGVLLDADVECPRCGGTGSEVKAILHRAADTLDDLGAPMNADELRPLATQPAQASEKFLGIPVVVDDSIPDGEVRMRSGDQVVVANFDPDSKPVGTEFICSGPGCVTRWSSTHPQPVTPADSLGEYAACCDTPSFCSSVRRCTRLDAEKPVTPAGGEVCVVCGSDEPYTGTCGSNDQRALCKRPHPPVSLYSACQRAARDLPQGWEIRICLESGAGTVELIDPDGEVTHMDEDADDRLPAEVNAAIDAALNQRGGGDHG